VNKCEVPDAVPQRRGWVFSTSTSSDERQGDTHHGGAGDVGASDDSLDSQEAPRKLHDNSGVLGFFRNAISGP
jgi:hypothetical protein